MKNAPTIKKTSVWETADGRKFEDRRDAQRHEKARKLEEILEGLDLALTRGISAASLAAELLACPRLHITILPPGAKR